VAVRIKSMKNPTDHNGNRTRDFSACSAVLQCLNQLRTPFYKGRGP